MSSRSEEQEIVPGAALRPKLSPPIAAGLSPLKDLSTAAWGGRGQKNVSLAFSLLKRCPSWGLSHLSGV